MSENIDLVSENIDLDNPEFQNVWSLLTHTRDSVFMTGKAGTGKSTFLRYITEHTTKKYVVLAPTGIAAVNVGGVTLHSFFRIPLSPLMPDDVEFSEKRLRKRLKYPRDFIRLLQELDLIIIDEISMVRADILDFVDKVLRLYTRNHREPFGGKQMLFVGDIFQLEPVVTSDTRDIMRRWYRSAYFFDALVFNSMNLVPIELKKIYRQTDPRFISLLDRVRTNTVSPDDLRTINSRYVRPESVSDAKDDFVMTLASRRDIVTAINDEHLAELPGQEHMYQGLVTGDFPASSMPTDLNLTLKCDAQIVFIRNDHEKRWVNGTLARVHELADDHIIVELEDGRLETIEPDVWQNVRYSYDEIEHKVNEEVLGTFSQLPVKLAWALTIHKSQGLTFNRVRIDMGRGAFTSGQTYVALSRSRSLEGLELLAPLFERDIFVNPAVVNFSRQFNDDLRVRTSLEHAAAERHYHDAAEAAGRHDHTAAFDSLVSAMLLNDAPMRDDVLRRYARRKLLYISEYESRISELREQLEACRQRFDDMAEEYVALGNICLDGTEDVDLDAAIGNYDKALELSPDNYNALLGRARALRGSGRCDDAVEAYQTMLTRRPDDYTASKELADVYVQLNELHDALNYYMKAAQADPKASAPLLCLADIYDQLGEPDTADDLRAQARRLTAKPRRPRRK